MSRFDDSLMELVERNATKVLVEGGTHEGMLALHRMFLLFSMIERLEEGGGAWEGVDLLPSVGSLELDQVTPAGT